jgi:uncharacterized membrane protein
MYSSIVDFTNLLVAALLVGAMFGVSLMLNPSGLSASNYVALQQRGIRTLHPALPILGAATILVTITAAVLGRDDHTRLWLLITAVVCFLAAGLITRFLNMPINAIVMTWSSDSLPGDWAGLRDGWWKWHCVRLLAGLVGLSFLIAAMLRRGWIG